MCANDCYFVYEDSEAYLFHIEDEIDGVWVAHRVCDLHCPSDFKDLFLKRIRRFIGHVVLIATCMYCHH